MDRNIQVDASRLNEASNEIKNAKDSLARVMEEIEILILSTNGAWQGDSERAFSEKIVYVKRQFSTIASFFDDYSELLKTFAAGYEQQESDLASKINLA